MKNKAIIICFSISEGSLSDYFIALSNNLSKSFQIIIISDKKNKTKKINDSIIVKYWPSKRPTKIIDFFFYYKQIKKYNPILTISMFGSVNISVLLSFLLGVKYRVAWIRSLSTQIDHNRFNIIRKSIIYKLANIIIANSNSTSKDSSTFYSIKEDKVMTLPNSVEDNYDHFCDLTNDHNKILYVGRLHKTKGVDTLLDAFEVLSEEFDEIELVIVGSGPERSNLINKSNKLAHNNRIKFKGKLSKKEVLENMKTSYLSVIPSKSEAFGYTVIEAMSMKTCVVGADNTGISEIIRHEETGLLFETGSHKDLAKKIKFLYNNPEKRKILANKGYQHFKEKYSTEIAVKRDASFFVNLIEENEDEPSIQ